MLADMTKRPGSVGMYDVGGNSVGLTLTGNAGECAAELYSEHYEDIALTAMLVPDDGSDPVGVFPWKEPDIVVGVFTAAAWDAYEASGEKRTLFVRKEQDSEWRACLIADGKLRGLETRRDRDADSGHGGHTNGGRVADCRPFAGVGDG